MDILIIFVILLLYLLYRYLTKDFDYWQRRNVVFEPPLILIGNMKEFLLGRKNAGEVYETLYNKYPEKRFVGTFKMSNPDLMLTQPEDIKRVLISDFTNFQNRSNVQNNDDNPLTKNLFNLQFEAWKPMRQKVSPAFTTTKLKNMVPLMLEIGEEFTEYMNQVFAEGGEVDVKELMARYTTDVIGSCGFGIKANSIADEKAQFRRMGRLILAADNSRLIKGSMRILFPKLFNLLKLSVLKEETNDFFLELPKRIMAERIASGIKRNDFIDLMIELRDQEKKLYDSKITDDFIAAQVFVFFAAGFETSSSLMSFTLYELAKNPDIQNKVYEEIDSVLKNNDGKLSYDLISEMTYLDMVVSEVQRKYPALGNITRVCTSKYRFPDSEVYINKGISVTIPLLAIHHDPKYYPEPEKFIPERFTPEAKRLRDSVVYMPFGDGPRNCVGLRLGKMQSIIGLITVLKGFSVETCSRTPSKIVFATKSLALAAKDGVWLKLKKKT